MSEIKIIRELGRKMHRLITRKQNVEEQLEKAKAKLDINIRKLSKSDKKLHAEILEPLVNTLKSEL